VPNVPAFGREVFTHEIKTLAEGLAYDDVYHMNTQSGTQWDGFRHFAHMSSGSFYNGVCIKRASDKKIAHIYYRLKEAMSLAPMQTTSVPSTTGPSTASQVAASF